MDLYAVLAQVRELLQRQGRVSYRALKVQFSLDDAQLAALKDELIEAQRLAVDERGRVLVWVGETDPQPDQPPQSVPIAPSLPAPESERRQLTVLFCDLVDSTSLAQQLDPEDYRVVVRAYQEAAVAAVQPFDGYVAQYLGDGLLVYFGYPQAHEGAAQPAVRAGLAMVEAMEPLHTRLMPCYGVRVAVRLGLHTGVVVVGSMGSSDRQEQLALGDTPNIAARLQGMAVPNTVVLSAVTASLLHGAFALEDLGVQQLKGVAEPMTVYRVLGPKEPTRDEAEPVLGRLSFLVGREAELGLLLRRWEQSKAGLGQVVLLSGEAGIGKTALVEGLRAHVAQEGYTRVRFRGSPYHTHSALYPVIEHLRRVLRLDRQDAPEAALDKLERALQGYRLPLAEVVSLLAALLSVLARHFAALLHHRRRDVPVVQAQADALLTLASAQGFPLWSGFGICWQGRVLAMQGQGEEGLAQMHQGVTTILATGQELSRPLCLVLLAEATGHTGQVDEGLCLLAEALEAFETSGRGDMLTEAYRLQGELLLRQATPDAAQAEACFQQALAIARRQQARSWELRAAMSLSRLWQQQGKRAEARELLAPIYGWFTEGFDTPDLQDARALLDVLT